MQRGNGVGITSGMYLIILFPHLNEDAPRVLAIRVSLMSKSIEKCRARISLSPTPSLLDSIPIRRFMRFDIRRYLKVTLSVTLKRHSQQALGCTGPLAAACSFTRRDVGCRNNRADSVPFLPSFYERENCSSTHVTRLFSRSRPAAFHLSHHVYCFPHLFMFLLLFLSNYINRI